MDEKRVEMWINQIKLLTNRLDEQRKIIKSNAEDIENLQSRLAKLEAESNKKKKLDRESGFTLKG